MGFNGEPGPWGLCAGPSKCTDLDRPAMLIQSQCYASVFHGASASSDKVTRSCSYISAQNCAARVETGLPHFVRAWTQSRNRYSLRLLFPYRKDENHRAAATRMSASDR